MANLTLGKQKEIKIKKRSNVENRYEEEKKMQ